MKARAVVTRTVRATKRAGVARSTATEMVMRATVVAAMMANATNTMGGHTAIN